MYSMSNSASVQSCDPMSGMRQVIGASRPTCVVCNVDTFQVSETVSAIKSRKYHNIYDIDCARVEAACLHKELKVFFVPHHALKLGHGHGALRHDRELA